VVKTEKYLVLESHRDRISTLEFWDNGIIFIKIDDNTEIGLEDSKKQYAFLLSKYNGKDKHIILVEPGRYTTISKEAREFSEKPETNEMTSKTAVIVKSLAHRIVINFIISIIRQQTMKMRMFDNKKKAIEWLLLKKQI
jgi:hypothetical protein